MIYLHDSVLLLSEFLCFSNGLRHVRNYRAENFGDISMQRHLVVEFPLERLILNKITKFQIPTPNRLGARI